MTTKDELRTKKRHRYMLRGDVGSGKTHSLVMLAKRYASEDKRVLFIDYIDIGSVEELEKLDDNLLTLIDYETPASYTELIGTHIHNDVKLIIVDAMHHLRFTARKHIRDQFIAQGHYTAGAKQINIEDVDTFDLGVLGYGAGYAAANIRENDFVNMLMNSGIDIAISVIPEPRGDRPTFTDILMANFDNIVDLSFRDNDNGTREWFYKLYRWRGIESNDYGFQSNQEGVDPFAVIERTGGKQMKEFIVRYTFHGERTRTIIESTDIETVKALLSERYPEATDVEVLE